MLHINNFNNDFQNFDLFLPSYNSFKTRINKTKYLLKIYFHNNITAERKYRCHPNKSGELATEKNFKS